MKDMKKKKKKVADNTMCGFTDVQANVDAFNHHLSGVGNITGTASSMGESLDEEDEDENMLPDVSEDAIIGDEDAGISSLFIDAINDCWSTIDNYHSIIVTLDSLDRHEFDDTLQGLLEDKNKEVGALQGILEMLSPASAKIEQGKEEAQEESSFDQVEEDFCLNESIIKRNRKRKRVSESKKSKTIAKLLKEDWNSNGKLEDFEPEELIKKSFENKYSTYSIRDFNGKQLYINIDPGFHFGIRAEDAKIWINVVQIDGDDQERVFLDSALSEEEAEDKLNNWKIDYMSNSESAENAKEK